MAETDDALIAALRSRAASIHRTDVVSPQELRAPASEETIASTEAELGFSLDPFLRRVYGEVANGGFGPGYGCLPLTGPQSLSSVYADFRSGAWPEKLLPVWDWGGALWSCVDFQGRIVTHDDVAGPILTNFTVRSWLKAWTESINLWNELYEDKEETIINPFTRKPVATKVRGKAKGRPWP